MVDIQLVVDARALIGESPIWSPDEHALYWADIKAPALHRIDVRDHSQRSWTVTSDLGAYCLLPDREGAIVALREGLCRLDFASGSLTSLGPPPYDPALFRFNEGACDATGRFWVGVMFDPQKPGAIAQPASLHSFTLGGGMRHEPDAAELHNGMAWSPDGQTFYLSHSNLRTVYAFIFDASRGSLSGRRPFVETAPRLGVPDGAAVDSDGGYWCALHGGGRLHRYTAGGTLDLELLLPVSQPTMCAFGGEALDVLYITSARDRLSAEQLQKEPLAGAVFSARTGHIGVPRRSTLR